MKLAAKTCRRLVIPAMFLLLTLLAGPACHAADGAGGESAWSLRQAVRQILQIVFPGAPAHESADAAKSADALTLEQAVGQMLLIGFRGLELDAETAALLREIRPGGVLLFDRDGPSGGELPRNIESPRQLRALTAALQQTAAESAPAPYLIALDAEGGYVNRLKEKYGFTVEVPTALTLGSQTVADTAQIAANLAGQLKDLGINLNLAPVVDVNLDPASPAIGRWERSFSDDPAVVAAHAAAFIQAHRRHGIATALKHFPGHGSAADDTHLGVTDITATYRREIELAPYRRLIADGYPGAIMTAHVVHRGLDPDARPATLSPPIITGILRQELNFGGVIVSDDLQMAAIVAQYGQPEAAIAAVQAGVDLLMFANQQGEYRPETVREVKAAIIRAVADGRISEQAIRESAQRILDLKGNYNIIP